MLKNLKVAVQNHFEGQKHKLNAEKREEIIRLTQGRLAKNKCIAARATRTGYYVLKKYLAHAGPPYHGTRCRGIRRMLRPSAVLVKTVFLVMIFVCAVHAF